MRTILHAKIHFDIIILAHNTNTFGVRGLSLFFLCRKISLNPCNARTAGIVTVEMGLRFISVLSFFWVEGLLETAMFNSIQVLAALVYHNNLLIYIHVK